MTTPRQRPRTCVACREESPKRALIRIVRSPAGAVFLDERGKLPGRGAYLCADRECLEKARKTKGLARALKTDIPEDLYDRLAEYIESYVEKHDLSDIRRELRLLLGLSRRAKLIYIGVDSVKSECVKPSAKNSLLILTASDASESVKDSARRQSAEPGYVHKDVPLTAEEFSAALGASGVQVIALPAQNGLAGKIKMLIS